MLSQKSNSIKAILVIFTVLFVDQFVKIYIKLHFQLGEQVEVFNWFKIYFIENNGMAFGIEFIGKLFLTLFRIFAVGILIFYIRKLIKNEYRTGYIVTISLLTAGAAGNIFDSLFYGMKKIFYSIVFLLALVSGTATAEQIDISKIQNSGMSRPKVRAYVPMTASIENSVVTVDFQYSVGVATISICDSDGNVVFSNLYDTDSSLEAVIPLDALESGTYTIYISYGSSTFNGLFDI